MCYHPLHRNNGNWLFVTRHHGCMLGWLNGDETILLLKKDRAVSVAWIWSSGHWILATERELHIKIRNWSRGVLLLWLLSMSSPLLLLLFFDWSLSSFDLMINSVSGLWWLIDQSVVHQFALVPFHFKYLCITDRALKNYSHILLSIKCRNHVSFMVLWFIYKRDFRFYERNLCMVILIK